VTARNESVYGPSWRRRPIIPGSELVSGPAGGVRPNRLVGDLYARRPPKGKYRASVPASDPWNRPFANPFVRNRQGQGKKRIGTACARRGGTANRSKVATGDGRFPCLGDSYTIGGKRFDSHGSLGGYRLARFLSVRAALKVRRETRRLSHARLDTDELALPDIGPASPRQQALPGRVTAASSESTISSGGRDAERLPPTSFPARCLRRPPELVRRVVNSAAGGCRIDSGLGRLRLRPAGRDPARKNSAGARSIN